MPTVSERARWLSVAVSAGLVASVSAAGCILIADIGDMQYETGAGGSTQTGTGGGTSTGTGGGTGLDGGSGGGGGVAPTCTDGEMNGDETGIDCGGPDCDPCDEDCTNGVDDDGNTLIDCADPLCSAYGCIPEVPQDWSGPVALFVGADDATLPACGAGWPERTTGGSGTFSAAEAACTDCTCGTPTGASCEAPTLSFFASGDCSGAAVVSAQIAVSPGACDSTSFDYTNLDSVVASPLPVSGGQCASSGGEATVDPEVWQARHVLCAGVDVGAGCGAANQVCVRSAAAPFETSLCITQAGDVSCPADDYTERTLVYTSLADTRDCVSCACGAPSGMSCEGATTVYLNQACNQGEETVPNDGTSCVARDSLKAARYSVVSGPSGGSCTASGGDSTGSATPGDPVTVCCLP